MDLKILSILFKRNFPDKAAVTGWKSFQFEGMKEKCDA
jgi:hypothetical protein